MASAPQAKRVKIAGPPVLNSNEVITFHLLHETKGTAGVEVFQPEMSHQYVIVDQVKHPRLLFDFFLFSRLPTLNSHQSSYISIPYDTGCSQRKRSRVTRTSKSTSSSLQRSKRSSNATLPGRPRKAPPTLPQPSKSLSTLLSSNPSLSSIKHWKRNLPCALQTLAHP